jgi:hypothetical protein
MNPAAAFQLSRMHAALKRAAASSTAAAVMRLHREGQYSRSHLRRRHRRTPPGMPVVGFLLGGSLTDMPTHLVTAFHQGLKEAGFVEGQNVAIEYRSDEHQPDKLRLLVADLLHRQVALIVLLAARP